jgi:hypothetical protein
MRQGSVGRLDRPLRNRSPAPSSTRCVVWSWGQVWKVSLSQGEQPSGSQPSVLNSAAPSLRRERWWRLGQRAGSVVDLGRRSANALLATAIGQVDASLVDDVDRYDNRYLKLRGDATHGALRAAVRGARSRFGEDLAGVEPSVSADAVSS